MPKFHEIRNHFSDLKELTDKEEYMVEILRKKQAWKAASTDVRSLGTQSQDFYLQ